MNAAAIMPQKKKDDIILKAYNIRLMIKIITKISADILEILIS